MNRQEALSLARETRDLSKQGLELIHQGKYREGHNLSIGSISWGK